MTLMQTSTPTVSIQYSTKQLATTDWNNSDHLLHEMDMRSGIARILS